MDTLREPADDHAALADLARRTGRGARPRRVGRRARPAEVEVGADRQPARHAGRLGALHAARHGRPRPDEPERGRVRGHARPGDAAGPRRGTAGRVLQRRPALRRARSRSPTAPARSSRSVPRQAEERGYRFMLGVETGVLRVPPRRACPTSCRSPRSARCSRRRPTTCESTLDSLDFLGRRRPLHGRRRLRAVQLRPRGRRRPVRAGLRPRRRAGQCDRLVYLPAPAAARGRASTAASSRSCRSRSGRRGARART